MENKENITIQDLEKYYEPFIWESVDQITNLSDETVGYYAYLLQEELNKRDSESGRIFVKNLFLGNTGGIFKEKMSYKTSQLHLKNIESILISKPLTQIICPLKESEITYKEIRYEPSKMILHQFQLFFRVYHRDVGHPVVIRNGYLLKCLNESGIKTFEELDEYKAVLIYNQAEVNSHICSFVRFEK